MVIQNKDLRPFIQDSSFVQELHQYGSLQNLTLDDCCIEFFQLKYLSPHMVNIALNNNKLQVLNYDPDGIELANLKHLNLSNNQFKALPLKTIIAIKAPLTTLDMSRNLLTSLPTNDKMSSIQLFATLEELDLSSNNLKYFPKSVNQMQSLKVLRLIAN